MSLRSTLAGLCCALVLSLVATAVLALPPSLRSEEDLRDAVDTVMRSVSAGQEAAGVRALGSHTTIATDEFARLIVSIDKESTGRRKSLGLGLSVEEIQSRPVGARLHRITRLYHYDKGYVAWHFTFHRPAATWQLIALDVVENDPSVFAFAQPSSAAGGPKPAGEPSPVGRD